MEFFIHHSKKIFLSLVLVGVVALGFFYNKSKKERISLEAEIPFEHSLMVHDKKITSFRSPASLRREKEQIEKALKQSESKRDEKRDEKDAGDDSSPGTSGSSKSNSDWSANDRVSPPSYVANNNYNSQGPTAPTAKNAANSSKPAAGKLVMGAIYNGFNNNSGTPNTCSVHTKSSV